MTSGTTSSNEGDQTPQTPPSEELTPSGGSVEEGSPKKGGADSSGSGKKSHTVKDSQVGGDVIFNYGNFQKIQESQTRELSLNDFRPYTAIQIEELASDIICDPVILENLLSKLQDKRLLILCGEPEIGKGTVGFLLADRFRKSDINFSELLFSSNLEKEIKGTDVRDLSENDQYRNKFLIFKDAFQNRNLIDSLQVLDQHRLETISASLRNNSSFILLTADTLVLEKQHVKLPKLEIVEELSPLNQDLLVEGLQNKVKKWFKEDKINEINEWIEEQDKNSLFTRLNSMPKIVRFVEKYLGKVVNKELTLLDALQRLDNITDWFIYDLVDDFDAWCFTVALTLAYAHPQSWSVPWFNFHQFRNALSRFMQRELRIRRKEDRSLKDIVTDDFLLKRVCAEIKFSPYLGCDTVNFKEDIYSTELWRGLLAQSKNLLGMLVPWLRNLLNESDTQLNQIRFLAARALGRIGELDPYKITFNLISDFINFISDKQNPLSKENISVRASLLGSLFQGLLGSNNKIYQDYCFRALRNIACNADYKTESAIAITSLVEVGEVDLDRAMTELEEIIRQRFSSKLKEIENLEGKVRQLGEDIALTFSQGNVNRLNQEDHNKLVDIVMESFFSGDIDIFYAICNCIVNLCFKQGAVDVFERLSGSINRNRKEIAPLICLLFLLPRGSLHRGGIADILGEYKIPLSSSQIEKKSNKIENINLIIFSMIFNSKSVNSVAIVKKFLEHIYTSCNVFPGAWQHFLEERFFEILTTWAKEAYPLSQSREVILDLFCQLLQSTDKILREYLFDLLVRGSDYTEQGADLKDFADKVLNRSMQNDLH